MKVKAEIINHWLDSHDDIGIFLLRLFVGGRLFYGVVDNVMSWERMIEFSSFLEAQDIPAPIFSAVLSAYSQFIASLCILFGYKIRVASAVMVFNFVVAMIVHLRLNDTIEAMTPALAMLFGCLAFIFMGAGRYAISNREQRQG